MCFETVNTKLFICVCAWYHPLTAFYPESAVSPGAPASSFLLPPSAQCSETKRSRSQESLSNTRSAQNNLWLHKSFITQQSGRILNIITLIFSHFNSSLEVKKVCLNIKGSVRTHESPQSGYVRTSSCCLGSCIVPPHFTLFALISLSLPSKRWV